MESHSRRRGSGRAPTAAFYPGRAGYNEYFSGRPANDVDFSKQTCRDWFWQHSRALFDAGIADETGIGLVRPLFYDYPADPGAANVTSEWMFGEWLLVAPVVEQEVGSKRVYLPAGIKQRITAQRTASSVTVETGAKTGSFADGALAVGHHPGPAPGPAPRRAASLRAFRHTDSPPGLEEGPVVAFPSTPNQERTMSVSAVFHKHQE